MTSFHAFLIAAAELRSVSSDPWRDIGADVAADTAAPQSDAVLHAYLKQRVDEDLLEDAWREYLMVRS